MARTASAVNITTRALERSTVKKRTRKLNLVGMSRARLSHTAERENEQSRSSKLQGTEDRQQTAEAQKGKLSDRKLVRCFPGSIVLHGFVRDRSIEHFASTSIQGVGSARRLARAQQLAT